MAEFEVLEDKYIVNFVEDKFNVSVTELITVSNPDGATGDMSKAMYDPNNVSGDAFDMDNMSGGETNQVVAQSEKSGWDSKADGEHTHNYEPADNNIQSHISNTSNPHNVGKSDVSLGSVDNTPDSDKPVSTDVQSALDGKSGTEHDHSGTYEPVNLNIQEHVSSQSNPHNVNKTTLGIENVNNTSDANKPISTDTQTALDLKRRVDDYVFGKVGDYTEFEEDGTLTMKGTATVWEDIQGSLIGRRLFSNQGSVDYSYAENAIVFSDGGDITDDNDCVIWNYQYPHKAKPDGELRMHMHYELSGPLDYEFTLRYRVQETGGQKTTAWQEVIALTSVNNVFPYVLGVLNQITTLAEIDMTGFGISSQIQFRLTRSDTNGGTVNATFVDGHYESDTLGSNEEFVK